MLRRARRNQHPSSSVLLASEWHMIKHISCTSLYDITLSRIQRIVFTKVHHGTDPLVTEDTTLFTMYHYQSSWPCVRRYVEDNKDPRLIHIMLWDLAVILEELHRACGVVHTALSVDNIFMRGSRVVLSDFTLAERYDDDIAPHQHKDMIGFRQIVDFVMDRRPAFKADFLPIVKMCQEPDMSANKLSIALHDLAERKNFFLANDE